MEKETSVTQQQVNALLRSMQDSAISSQQSNPDKRVVLMRGLPASGKSHAAREIAGLTGVVCETDRFLRAELDGEECTIETARSLNYQRFCRFVEQGHPLIVVDRGNGLNDETYIYVNTARSHGYQIELREPMSPWWQEIRTLLRYRPATTETLECWAIALAEINARTNGVSAETILDWLDGWVADLTVSQLIAHASDSNVIPPLDEPDIPFAVAIPDA